MSGENLDGTKKEDISKVDIFQLLKSSTDQTDGEIEKFKKLVKRRVLKDCLPEAKLVSDCYGGGWVRWCTEEVDAYWACFYERKAFYISEYVKKFQDIGTKSITKSFLDTEYVWDSKPGNDASSSEK